jgi:hypothetical protein
VNVRFAGMVIAVSVSFAATIPLRLLSTDTSLLGAGLGVLGGPVAGLLGWWLTPIVVRGSWRYAAVFGTIVGLAAAYLGVLEVAYLGLLDGLAGGDPSTGFRDDALGVLFIAIVGPPYGTLVLPVTVPCGVVWALLVRGAIARLPEAGSVGPSSVGVVHLMIVLILVAIGAWLVGSQAEKAPNEEQAAVATLPARVIGWRAR